MARHLVGVLAIALMGAVAAHGLQDSDDVEDDTMLGKSADESALNDALDVTELSLSPAEAPPTPAQMQALGNLLKAAGKGHGADAAGLAAVRGQAAGSAAGNLEQLKRLGQLAAMAGKRGGGQAAGGFLKGVARPQARAAPAAFGGVNATIAEKLGAIKSHLEKEGAKGPEQERLQKVLSAPGGPEKLAKTIGAIQEVVQGFKAHGKQWEGSGEGGAAIKRMGDTFQAFVTKK